MDSKLCQSHAFVETLPGKKCIHVDERRVTGDDGIQRTEFYDVHCVEQVHNHKVYTFDLNLCRTNQMIYSQSDYPLFTVADEPQVYKINTKKKPGLYYIVITSYFPLRGSGWYSQAAVEYCLSNHIISEEGIKYVFFSSLSIPKKILQSIHRLSL